MDRRALLKLGLIAAPLLATGSAFAVPKTDQRLLVVFLRGAYDATNVIIPTSSDFYYQARPSLAIARPDPANPKASLPLDRDWSLHPALRASLYPLWEKKQLAFIPFAGTDDMSRSHFETQDTLELGQPTGGGRNYGSGFLGRLADALGADRPIAFSDRVPLIFHGANRSVPNLALNGIGKPSFDARQEALIEAMYKGPGGQAMAPEASVTQGFDVRDEAFKSIQQEMMQASRGAVTSKGFELQARRVAGLMRDEFNLAFLDVGGWDTHVNQGAADGQLADRIGDLGRGLAGFADEIGPRWADTTVIVISEFGRTFRENGDKGTDHGHGSIYWVMGGAVRGGRMAGPQVGLTPASLNQNRDLPVLTDYRAMIGGVAARLYGLGGPRLEAVFPQAKPVDLHLV